MTIEPAQMPPSYDAWHYTGLSKRRESYLMSPPSFEDIADAISAGFHVIGRRIRGFESYKTPLELEARQIVIRIETTNVLADQFFNGRDGLRARYWHDPTVGDRATRYILDAMQASLLSDLIGYRDQVETVPSRRGLPVPPMSIDDIESSLLQASAKIWPVEDDMSEVGLEVKRWRESGRQQWEWTPTGSILEVKGALIDLQRVEHIPLQKQNRALQIHEHGFS